MRIWGVTDLFPFADIDIFLLECPLLYKNYFEFFSCGAFSSQSILLGNIQTALPTPGTADHSALPITSLSLAGSNQANNPLATSLLYSQSNTQSAPNTNTSQNSSLKSIYVRFSVVLLELECKVLFLKAHRARKYTDSTIHARSGRAVYTTIWCTVIFTISGSTKSTNTK